MKEKNIHKIFIIGLVLKGLDGLVEILGSFIFLITGSFGNLILFLTKKELVEDPTDFLANYFVHLIPYLPSYTKTFIFLYLFIHGIIKIFLLFSLLLKKKWAYPLAILILIFFVIYQTYQLINKNSIILSIITILDIALIFLTWHEYKYVKSKIL